MAGVIVALFSSTKAAEHCAKTGDFDVLKMKLCVFIEEADERPQA